MLIFAQMLVTETYLIHLSSLYHRLFYEERRESWMELFLSMDESQINLDWS